MRNKIYPFLLETVTFSWSCKWRLWILKDDGIDLKIGSSSCFDSSIVVLLVDMEAGADFVLGCRIIWLFLVEYVLCDGLWNKHCRLVFFEWIDLTLFKSIDFTLLVKSVSMRGSEIDWYGVESLTELKSKIVLDCLKITSWVFGNVLWQSLSLISLKLFVLRFGMIELFDQFKMSPYSTKSTLYHCLY